MSQNHLSKYDKAETWSAMRVQSMKEVVLLRETMNYDINIPFTLVHYFQKHFMT